MVLFFNGFCFDGVDVGYEEFEYINGVSDDKRIKELVEKYKDVEKLTMLTIGYIVDTITAEFDTVKQNKRELLFVQLLEGLSADEAEFLVTVVNKKVNNKYKGFTGNLVKEAFGWNDNFAKP